MFAEQYSVDPAVEKLLIKNYERRKRFALTMQKHATIPWYLIEIPLIGLKPQKFKPHRIERIYLKNQNNFSQRKVNIIFTKCTQLDNIKSTQFRVYILYGD